MLSLALRIWKVNQMVLLSTTSSDWKAWEGERTCSEKNVPQEGLQEAREYGGPDRTGL